MSMDRVPILDNHQFDIDFEEEEKLEVPETQVSPLKIKKQASYVESDYAKPDWAKTKEYRKNNHPYDLANDRPWNWRSVSTGQHWFASKDEATVARLWCLGKDKPKDDKSSNLPELVIYGVGIVSYFKFLKWVGWLFTLISVLHIPVYVLYGSVGNHFLLSDSIFNIFLKPTLGNMFIEQPGNGTTITEESLGVYTFGYFGCSDCSIEANKVLAVVTFIDFICVLIFMFAVQYLKFFQYKDEREWNHSSPKLNDFSVEATVISPDADAYSLKEHLEKVLDVKVYDVQIVNDTDTAFEIGMKRSKLLKKLGFYQAKVDMLQSLKANPKRIAETKAQLAGVKSAVRLLDANSWDAVVEDEHAVVLGAFITFEDIASRDKCLRLYNKSVACGRQPRRLQYQGHALKLQYVPGPSTLLWENMGYSDTDKELRRLCGCWLVFMVLLVAGVIAFLAKSFSTNNLDTDQPELLCDYAAFDGKTPAQVSTIIDSAADPDSTLLCYCQQQLLGLNKAEFSRGGLCYEFGKANSSQMALDIMVSFCVLLINAVIVKVIYRATRFEKFSSVVKMEATLYPRLFVVTFINTAIVILFANTNMETAFGFKIPVIGDGSYDDFTVEWYQTVGVELMLVFVGNVFAPHGGPLANYFVTQWKRKRATCVNQTEQNALWLGPKFVLSVRYAQVMVTIFFALMYGSGIPILYTVVPVSAFVTYWVDKFLFLRFTRTPPVYTNGLANKAASMLRYAVVLHCAVAAWMYSSPSIFPRTVEEANNSLIEFVSTSISSGIKKSESDSFAAYLQDAALSIWVATAERFGRPYILKFVVLGCLVLLWELLKLVDVGVMLALRYYGKQQAAKAVGYLCNIKSLLGETYVKADDGNISLEAAIANGSLTGLRSYHILSNRVYKNGLTFNSDPVTEHTKFGSTIEVVRRLDELGDALAAKSFKSFKRFDSTRKIRERKQLGRLARLADVFECRDPRKLSGEDLLLGTGTVLCQLGVFAFIVCVFVVMFK